MAKKKPKNNKKTKKRPTIWQNNSTHGYIYTWIQENICTLMFTVALFIIAKKDIEATLSVPSTDE